MIDITEYLEAEPWLAGYLRAGDKIVDDVRRRARRAISAEAERRTRAHEQPLLVRRVADNGKTTTALDDLKIVADSRDEVSTRPVERAR